MEGGGIKAIGQGLAGLLTLQKHKIYWWHLYLQLAKWNFKLLSLKWEVVVFSREVEKHFSSIVNSSDKDKIHFAM